MERTIELLKNSASRDFPAPEVFIAAIGDRAARESMAMADRLRGKGFWVELGDVENSLKSQMRRADRLSSKYVFIIGEDELNSGRLKWKKLSDSSQGEISMFEITDFLQQRS